MAIIVRGRNGGILQCDDRMGRAAVRIGGLDRNGPRGTVPPQAKGAHLAINADKARVDAMILQHPAQPVLSDGGLFTPVLPTCTDQNS